MFSTANRFSPQVPANESFDIGDADGYVWVRIKGKGSFVSSPRVKDYVDSRIKEGETRFVLDLDECRAMDSTFMGTLAGLAIRLNKMPGGKLQVAGARDRNRQSLEDLGLDVLIEIDPPGAEWSAHMAAIREGLEPWGESEAGTGARHVLEAHRTLAGVSAENAKKFETVLDVLEQEARGQ